MILPFLGFGQITKDTILIQDTLIIREVTKVEGATTTITRTIIGESQAEAVAYLVAQVTPEADRYAQQAVTFAGRRAIRNTLQPINVLLLQYTGSNYVSNAGAILGDAILGTYRYRKNDTGDLEVSIIRLQGGGLRFRHADVNYNVRVVSRRWITVIGFDGIPDLNLYWDSERAEWTSLDTVYNLKKL